MPRTFDPAIEQMLSELEEDPLDWTRIDICRILHGCGICRIEPMGAPPWAPERWSHPDVPSAWVLLYPTDRVSSSTVLRVLNCVAAVRIG